MLLSLWPNAQQPWTEIVTEVRHADSTGWHAVYLADHFMGDGGGFGAPETPTLEATAGLAALAALTERVRVGSLVLGNTYRHPAVVANWAVTLDHVSGGRAILGVGAGWQVNEHRQYGIELPAPGERVTRFDEACRVLRGLLNEPPTTVGGDHYRLTDALCSPPPVQDRLPLLIGGKGDRMLGVVARHADQWNMWGLPDTIAARSAVLDRRCEAIERDPRSVHRSTQTLVMLTTDAERGRAFVDAVAPRAAFAGSAAQFAELCGRWAEVGIDEVIVPDTALGTGDERLARLDELRAAVG
jgi:alkanesulfonate monooxygenase SsuD/methylene tetrahydromethanopterin reductase-like flavin-dependent oxidoreductase (luciferase family)